jgi:hypothetical protein
MLAARVPDRAKGLRNYFDPAQGARAKNPY